MKQADVKEIGSMENHLQSELTNLEQLAKFQVCATCEGKGSVDAYQYYGGKGYVLESIRCERCKGTGRKP